MYHSISDVLLYLGKDASHFFKGYMDEVSYLCYHDKDTCQ